MRVPLYVLASLANGDHDAIAGSSEDEKALARRCLIFCSDEHMFERSGDQYARKSAILQKANTTAFTL